MRWQRTTTRVGQTSTDVNQNSLPASTPSATRGHITMGRADEARWLELIRSWPPRSRGFSASFANHVAATNSKCIHTTKRPAATSTCHQRSNLPTTTWFGTGDQSNGWFQRWPCAVSRPAARRLILACPWQRLSRQGRGTAGAVLRLHQRVDVLGAALAEHLRVSLDGRLGRRSGAVRATEEPRRYRR